MISLSLGQILIGILLIALIVLVIFLIVLVSNATDTIKKANAILDGGTEAVSTAITKIEEASAAAKAEAEKAKAKPSFLAKLAQGVLGFVAGE